MNLSVSELIELWKAARLVEEKEVVVALPSRWAFIGKASDRATDLHSNPPEVSAYYLGAMWAYDLLISESHS